jgi:hypothetical protein
MKQKKQLAALVVLLLIAGAIWFFYFDHGRTVVTADVSTAVHKYKPLPVENPQLHTDGVERARKTEYKSRGRNIFSRELPPPPPPPHSDKPKPEPSGPKFEPPPPPPTCPTLPVKFFGYGTVPNGTVRLAFFSDGQEVLVVAEGELLMNRFRILRIGNANLEFEEISTGLRCTAPLEEQAGPPSA